MMTMMTTTMMIIVIIFGTLLPAVVAKAGAPAVDCLGLLSADMSSCLDFISSGNAGKSPGKSCCDGLKKVVATDQECLCQGFNMAGQLGIAINMTTAKILPSKCGLPKLSLTGCSSNSPTSAPSSSPAPSPSSAASSPSTSGEPVPSTTPTGAASAQSPAPAPTPGANSAGSLAAVSFAGSLLLGLVVFSSCF